MRKQPRIFSGLGELPGDRRREESFRGKRILNPGESYVYDWINRYTASLFPFTIGTTALRILPANALRTYLLIQNKEAVGSGLQLFVNFGQNPTTFASIRIEAGGNYELIGGATGGSFCPQDDVYILGSVAGVDGCAVEGLWLPSPVGP